MSKEDIVRVLRVIEYVGPRSWVEHTVSKSIHGKMIINKSSGSITAVTVGDYPDILTNAEEVPSDGK